MTDADTAKAKHSSKIAVNIFGIIMLSWRVLFTVLSVLLVLLVALSLSLYSYVIIATFSSSESKQRRK